MKIKCAIYWKTEDGEIFVTKEELREKDIQKIMKEKCKIETINLKPVKFSGCEVDSVSR